jgi:hypothetical protein
MTELTARLVLDLKSNNMALTLGDTFVVDDYDFIEDVKELTYKGRVIYRAFRVKTGHGGYILNVVDSTLEEYEPISHLDEIVSGTVKYKEYKWDEENSPDNEWALLPYCKIPEWALILEEDG